MVSSLENAPSPANILLLVPVCYRMLVGVGVTSVFDGRVRESEGLRLMVGSLWTAILVASIAGLFWPVFFAPIVLAHIFYKSLGLILFVLPLWRSGEPFPVGITTSFVLIVLSYPVFFGLALGTE